MNDGAPRWREIALHLAVWSLVAEGVMPHVLRHVTGDWRDVVAYTAGALVAGCWWHTGGVA